MTKVLLPCLPIIIIMSHSEKQVFRKQASWLWPAKTANDIAIKRLEDIAMKAFVK